MKIGIIGAMETEVELLKEQLESAVATRVAQMEFCEGVLSGVPCVVVRAGVGKVNAALCAQTLIAQYSCTHVVNTGAAGSLDARINIGDVVVSTDCVYHDVDATNFGYAPGEVPQLGVAAFEADAMMRNVACEAVAVAAPDVACFEERVATGDVFVRDDAIKQRIAEQFRAACCEMEGAAIAHACWLYGVPFVVLRAISDKADGSDAVAYPVFETKAAHDCARITSEMVRMLGATEKSA